VSAGLDPFDAASLATLRTMLNGIDPDGPPRLLPLQPLRRARAVCLIPGSFNPPTVAHLALADRALSDGYDGVHLVYAVRTVGKRSNGLLPEDRLMLSRAATPDRVGVLVSSAGLLADIAIAATAELDPTELALMVGGDKLEQLFEDRWYDDRDATLDRLFASARVIVAPRRDDAERVAQLIRAHPRWAPRIEICHLHPSVAEISSTRVRQVLRAGGDPSGLVPEPVAVFLASVGAFAPPAWLDGRAVDRYTMRRQLFELVMDARCTREPPDLHLLWKLAHDPGVQGRQLRAMLAATNGSGNGSVSVTGSTASAEASEASRSAHP
jgi:nicotinic acid mononucleotide adenylyltransferase